MARTVLMAKHMQDGYGVDRVVLLQVGLIGRMDSVNSLWMQMDEVGACATMSEGWEGVERPWCIYR